MQTSFCWNASDRLEILIEHLIPASGKLGIQQLRLSSEGLTLVLVSVQTEGQCPVCGQSTRQVHSTYMRILQALPWASVHLTLRVQVHRFFCQNPDCTRKILRNGYQNWLRLLPCAGYLRHLFYKSEAMMTTTLIFSSLSTSRTRFSTQLFPCLFWNGYPK